MGSGWRAWRKFQDKGWSRRVMKGINAKEERGETSRCAYTGDTGGMEVDERKGQMESGRRAGVWGLRMEKRHLCPRTGMLT